MPEADSAPTSSRSRRIYIYWGVAITLLLLLGLVCWKVVVPVWQTDAVLKEDGAIAVWGGWIINNSRNYSPDRAQLYPAARQQAATNRAMTRLGGRQEALSKLRLYINLPNRVARHEHIAIGLLGYCGRDARPVLEALLKDDDQRVRFVAASALQRLRAAAKGKQD